MSGLSEFVPPSPKARPDGPTATGVASEVRRAEGGHGHNKRKENERTLRPRALRHTHGMSCRSRSLRSAPNR